MASRKEQKEELRRARQQETEASRARSRRKRRLGIAAAAVGLAVIVVAVLIGINQSGSNDSGGSKGASEVKALLEGIPQSGNRLGDPKAPVTVQEFADLQCPACKALGDESLPDFIKTYVRQGKAKLEFRNLTIIGPESAGAAKAALAAGEQNLQWNYVENFYRNQGPENSGYVTDEFLTKIAEDSGVDVAAWEKARRSTRLDTGLKHDDDLARKLGFSSTPSLRFTGPGGSQTVSGVLSPDQLEERVDAAVEK